MRDQEATLAAICAATLLAALLAGAATTAALRTRTPKEARPTAAAETVDAGPEADGDDAPEAVGDAPSPADGEEGELPDGPHATDPVAPMKAKAGDAIELGGAEWRFEVAATYDAEELASAGRRVAPTLEGLPEGTRALTVRGFRADGERWAYAVAAGDGDAVRLVVSASSVLRVAPGVVEADARAWQAIVDASVPKGARG